MAYNDINVQNPFENLIANPWDELTMEEDGNIFPKSSVVTTKTDAKGVTESEVIVGQDDSKTTTSLFRPSKVFGDWFDPANYGLDSDKDTSKSGAILGLSDGGIDAILENESRIDRENAIEERMNLLTTGMMPGEIHPDAAVGSGVPYTGASQAEGLFEQSMLGTHVMPDSTVMSDLDMEGGESYDGPEADFSAFETNDYMSMDEQLAEIAGISDGSIESKDTIIEENNLADKAWAEVGPQSFFDNENELVETSKGIENEDFEVVEGVTKTDIDTLASNPDATEMLWEFEDDLEAADGDEVATEVALQDISEGISLFEDDNPQLAKSIYAMIAAMLMGQSFGDAMATGFGVMEEAAMKEDADTKTKNAELVGMLMENPEYMDSEDFLDSLRELGISEKDLPYYQKVYQAKKLKTNSTSASAWVAKQITAKDKIKSDLISDENTGHIDEFQRMIAHIEAKQDPNDPNTWFDFSDASQNWAIYEAQTNFERAKKKAIEDGDDSMVLEPVIYYENLFGLIDGNGDNSIVVSESSENQILQAMAKNSLRNVYGNSDAAEKAEMKISAAWYSEPLNKGKSNDEYLMHLAIEANELENEYLLGRQ